MTRRLIPLLAAALFAGSALAGEPGFLFKASDLKAEPFTDARTLRALPAQTAVEVEGRKGGWYRVKTADGGEGWLHMTGLRLGTPTAAAKGGDSGLGKAFNFLTTGRSGTNSVTVATGIRGLEPADVAHAQPDPKAVAEMEGFRVSAADARKFASRTKLKEVALDYPAPPRVAAQPAHNSSAPSLFGGE